MDCHVFYNMERKDCKIHQTLFFFCPILISRRFYRLVLSSSGMKVFSAAPKTAPFSYKLISMILACTGGGILVPLFLNGIPVPLANDAYPIAILASFAIHYYFPVVREVVKLSPWVKVCTSNLTRSTFFVVINIVKM